MKTISVLIAAFKAQAWIEDCLDSVWAQRLPPGWNLQVLLGIDGCAETLAAVTSIRCESLDVIYARHNQGTYVTFNTLMLYAVGELICRFDADDVMRPGYLSAQIDAIDSGADMTLTWSIYTDANLDTVPVCSRKYGVEDPNGFCRTAWEGQFVIRDAVWRRLGAFQPWRTSADTDFLHRVKAAGFRVHVVEQFLYFRRIHEHALTRHPDSNFQSALRQDVERLMVEYQREYLSGERPLSVRPEYALAHIRL
jgi:glycosyltransferase involved in cell wall biosynthesis